MPVHLVREPEQGLALVLRREQRHVPLGDEVIRDARRRGSRVGEPRRPLPAPLDHPLARDARDGVPENALDRRVRHALRRARLRGGRDGANRRERVERRLGVGADEGARGVRRDHLAHPPVVLLAREDVHEQKLAHLRERVVPVPDRKRRVAFAQSPEARVEGIRQRLVELELGAEPVRDGVPRERRHRQIAIPPLEFAA